MTSATTTTASTIWRDSGKATGRPRPGLTLVPTADAPLAEAPVPAIAIGPLRRLANRVIAASSLVPNDPVLDIRAFAWTATLRAAWRPLRDEAAADALLWTAGQATDAAGPATRHLLAAIPGLVDARIATLAPGTHVPATRGPTKALLTCHLALAVPRDGDARLRIADRIVRWAEGETLVFDDTHEHEAWNTATTACTVLSLRFARPLRNPGQWLARR